MPASPRARHAFPTFAALGLFLAGAALIGHARPPQDSDPKAKQFKRVTTEEEDPKGGVKKRVVVEDEAGTRKGDVPTGNTPDVRLDELTRAAAETAAPALKSLLAKFAVPSDRIVEGSGATSVKPIPIRRSEWPSDPGKEFEVTPLDSTGKPREPRRVKVGDVRAFDPFESLVLAEVDALAKQKAETPTAQFDNLTAGEKVLAAALRFHDYARERQIRRGKTWDELRDPLIARLREVRLEMLRVAIAAGDPLRIREAGTRLLNAYPKDAVVAQEVAAARVADAERLLKSGNHADHLRAKELLDEFEARFPTAGGEAAKAIRAQLRDMATKAFVRAKEKKSVGDLQTARDELNRAAALDSTVEGVRDLQRELRTGYPILYVGARHWPTNLSPATAKLDSERQAVELIFEGLLEEVPDENGSVHYRAAAALGLPAAVPGGREFLLRAYDRDSAGRPGFDSNDVVGTLKLMGERAATWQSYQLPWIGGLPAPKDANSVRIPFALGHPDPRTALTFKILPARWMQENGKRADDGQFAEKPFGSGPFKLYQTLQNPGGARELVFVDNPWYGRWRDRTGLPHLREIRLVEVAKLDPVEAFRTDKMHILPDVATGDLDKFVGPSSPLGNKVQVVTSGFNRRVHILAVNLQRPYLQNKALRQGLMMAIDREDILREVFRAGKSEYHRAMTGPYPPNSWANPKTIGTPPPLLNRDLAVARLNTYLGGTGPTTTLELAYPDGDPRAEDACRKIKTQIEGLTRDGPGGRKMTINLMRLPMKELITRVEGEHRYDLAYIPFDYPDDWHPFALGAALDPSAAALGGRNWFSFGVRESSPDADDLRLAQLLTEIRGYRDFAGQLAPRAGEAAKLFNECVPFIPLWQLDRHMVVHTGLKVFVGDGIEQVSPQRLNQTTLFHNVARWRLD